jgi:hypothetical protein
MKVKINREKKYRLYAETKKKRGEKNRLKMGDS